MACQVNQIFLGEIASVQNYGAFVKIPGCKQQGLVHKSQLSSTKVDDANDVLERGERVWCKIISIGDDGKVALSMKYVNQGSGKDLDPNNVQLELDDQKKKKFDFREGRKAIVLEAVYKTVCTRCKTQGHMAKDCFTTPDGEQYDLIPEEDDEPPPPVAPSAVENESKPKEKKHKLKKSKKKKKSKSKKKESNSEESDSDDERSKKKKKKSKEQKRKKRKRKNSSSDDSDSSDSSVSNSDNKRHSKKCKHSRSKSSD